MSAILNSLKGGYAKVDDSSSSSYQFQIPSPISSQKNQLVVDQEDDTYEMKQVGGESVAVTVSHTPIVRMVNVHKTYLLGVEGVAALRGVSLTIERGEFIVILGKSGSGKTSMLNILGTIDRPTKGDLYIAGQRISDRTSDEDLSNLRLNKLGFVFQTFNLIASMSAVENVELPMILAGTLTTREVRQRAMGLLAKVKMDDRYDHKPTQLSGGEQQRTTIARAISNEPELLLLDEPTGDLDTRNSHRVLKMLLDLNMDDGITMVMVTHDVALKNHAHRVVHMLDGKIQRIENVSEERRRRSYEELEAAIRLDNQSDTLAAESRKGVQSLTSHRKPEQTCAWVVKA